MAGEEPCVTGGCHCGAVRFSARLEGGLAAAIRCNCSLCRMRGAVVVFARLGDFQLIEGAGQLTTYRFHTGAAEHHFCTVCGIYTHHKRRLNSDQYAINAACLDGVSPFDFAAVPVMDGAHHPHDTGGTFQRAGTLRFEPEG